MRGRFDCGKNLGECIEQIGDEVYFGNYENGKKNGIVFLEKNGVEIF